MKGVKIVLLVILSVLLCVEVLACVHLEKKGNMQSSGIEDVVNEASNSGMGMSTPYESTTEMENNGIFGTDATEQELNTVPEGEDDLYNPSESGIPNTETETPPTKGNEETNIETTVYPEKVSEPEEEESYAPTEDALPSEEPTLSPTIAPTENDATTGENPGGNEGWFPGENETER